jgi:hypothetical protein
VNVIVVRDEKGAEHTTCHGVPADEWFRTIIQIRELLHNDPTQLGMAEIEDPMDLRCEDPDCRRLNRIRADGPTAQAKYELIKDLEPVRPALSTFKNRDNDAIMRSAPSTLENLEYAERERKICGGHPWKYGSYLCGSCARVASAKRLINSGSCDDLD